MCGSAFYDSIAYAGHIRFRDILCAATRECTTEAVAGGARVIVVALAAVARVWVYGV